MNADQTVIFATSDEALHRYANDQPAREGVVLVHYSSQHLVDRAFLMDRFSQEWRTTCITLLLPATGKSYLWFVEEDNPGTTSLMEVLRQLGVKVHCVICPTTPRERQQLQRCDLQAAVGDRTYEVWSQYSQQGIRRSGGLDLAVVEVPERQERVILSGLGVATIPMWLQKHRKQIGVVMIMGMLACIMLALVSLCWHHPSMAVNPEHQVTCQLWPCEICGFWQGSVMATITLRRWALKISREAASKAFRRCSGIGRISSATQIIAGLVLLGVLWLFAQSTTNEGTSIRADWSELMDLIIKRRLPVWWRSFCHALQHQLHLLRGPEGKMWAVMHDPDWEQTRLLLCQI
mmetsp:Transcript_65806/g.122726  ORF Transcript_65806/g.122726 Transcript_65806/m.122726 type:complete len:348 (+) Transcript_65806:66-1109(+)